MYAYSTDDTCGNSGYFHLDNNYKILKVKLEGRGFGILRWVMSEDIVTHVRARSLRGARCGFSGGGGGSDMVVYLG